MARAEASRRFLPMSEHDTPASAGAGFQSFVDAALDRPLFGLDLVATTTAAATWQSPGFTVDDLLDAVMAIRDPNAVARIRVAPGQAKEFLRLIAEECGEALAAPADDKAIPGLTPFLAGTPIVEDGAYMPEGVAVLLNSDGEVVTDGIIFFHPLPMRRIKSQPLTWPVERELRWHE